MAVTTFDPSEGPSTEQQAAEAAALEQGEKLLEAQQADRERVYAQAADENEDVSLIGGKFKSQDDLLKAYEELQKKLGSKDEEEVEEGTEAREESPEEAPEVEASETVQYMNELGKAYDETGEVSDEAIERLSQMDSKELIKSYLEYYKQGQAARQQQVTSQAQVEETIASVGGAEAYGEMVQWAAANLDPQEVASYNEVTNSGNPAAIKFAVEALASKYKAAEGFEAPLVSGKKAAPGVKPYRSQAELARDIADPRYSKDPAFRMDVEERLARSKDLL